ncbi:MAG: phosphate signaling complex protein PhoU [Oscillospiraceae bacterium]|nr:phosphate signaling complex protein PhoU [Oscillospiraceae bacterium]
MRNKFLGQLDALHEMLLEMGKMVQINITKASNALKEQNKELAKEVIESDHEINQMEKDIESLCMKILIRQNPVAGDFRLVSSALKMITDIERIGDQAADIAEISMFFDKPFIKKLEHIPQMAEATIKMVTDSLNAFVNEDLDLANSVIAQDDIVDDLFATVKNDLIVLISKDSNNGEQAIDLIMIAKYLERIGDHATNIAEWVIYSITGTHPNT